MSEFNPAFPSDANPDSAPNRATEANASETPCTHDISDFCPSAVPAEKRVDPATCETRELPVPSGIR